VRPWSEFTPPQAKHQHGIWAENARWEAHQKKRRIAGWREWTEGLDESELDANGHVLDQRARGRWVKPVGTRTYYGSNNAGPAIQSATFNASFTQNPTGASNLTDTGVNQNGQLVATFVSPTNQPDSAAWPTTGVYRFQLDVTAVGADLTYGVLTQGNGLGRFARADSAGTTTLQSFQQSQAAFSSSGLNVASITNPAWTAGAATNRWAASIAAIRVVGHGTQSITIQAGETDDFTDGPWAAPAAQAGNSIFFGSMF
jgi:hypothetical protein